MLLWEYFLDVINIPGELLWWLRCKESTCNGRYLGSIPRLGKSPGERNDNPLQYSHLENSMDRGAWQATVHAVTESDTTEWLSLSTFKLGFSGSSVVKKKKKKIHLPIQETQKTWIWSLGQKDTLQEEMATLSSILAWRFPWTEEPGGLQSMGSQRVRQKQLNTQGCQHSFWSQLQISEGFS